MVAVPTGTVKEFWWLSGKSDDDGDEVEEEHPATQPNGVNGVSKPHAKSRSRVTPPPPSAHSNQPESVLIVAATAQEPRLGRWMRVKEGGAASGVKVWVVGPKEEEASEI